MLTVYVSSIWYPLNTNCCPWSRKHASVINLPNTRVHIRKSRQTHTYLHKDIDRNTCMYAVIYLPDFKQASNLIRSLKKRLPQVRYSLKVE